MFELTAYPLFIRGKAGDAAQFVKAVSSITVDDPGKLPCRLVFDLKNKQTIQLTINTTCSPRN